MVNNITLIYHSPDLLKNIPESVVRGLFLSKMYILLACSPNGLLSCD
ncbi:hypothetical protein KKH3_42950 [Pectobacterium actinidiae]|nr:hypothetical protein KKH3_42950 [Pectobacterium actinidiae]